MSNRGLAGIVPVDVPVPHDRDRADVARSVGWPGHVEPADGALATFVIAVEEVDEDRATLAQGADDLVAVVVGVTKGSLPEADVARRDVEVARLGTELVGGRTSQPLRVRLGLRKVGR